MEVFTAWIKDGVAGQINLPATIHRDGTHYTALIKVSGRLDTSPPSTLAQVVGLFMGAKKNPPRSDPEGPDLTPYG